MRTRAFKEKVNQIHTIHSYFSKTKTPNVAKSEGEDWWELQRVFNAILKTNAVSVCRSDINKPTDTTQESQKKKSWPAI